MKKMLGWMMVSCLALAAPAAAQERPAPPRQVPLKLQVLVSRYQGEKKVSSMPYTLAVIANDNDKTSLRMGVEVPIPTTVFSGGKEGAATIPMTSYNYRSVGTNIDCSAKSMEDGYYRLDLAVEDSSIFVSDKEPARVPNTPSFRRFTSTFNLLLRDGQTAQHTTATDPVSGEVLKIDVTLNVLK